jgi:drug/metabolite transporter (DMT)-like permease
MNANLRAAIWMIGAIVSFSAMAVAGRAASQELDTFEIMLYRSLVGAVIVAALTSYNRKWYEITTQNFGLHAARNLAHFAGQNLWFLAITLIPLAHVFALEFTTPIWVLLLTAVFLKETIRPIGILAALICFVGVLVVTRPGATPISLGLLVAAASAIGFAMTFLLTKRLTQRHSITNIMFYLTTMQAFFGFIFSAMDLDVTLPSTEVLPYVVLIGLAGLLAHFCITNALKIAPPTVVAPVDFTRLPVIAVVGALLYGESLDIWIFVGALLIFAGNYINIVAETKHSQKITTG